MGLTNKLGLLAQSVQQDASLNIGIGGAANASYKLQVTGTTNLTGALSGTSATFSTDLVVNGWLRPNSIYAFTADSGTTYIQQPSGGNIVLRKSDSTPFLTIANTGAATFSSSITAASGLYNGYTSGLPPTSGSATRGGLRLNNASNIALDFGTVAAGQAWLQVSDANNYASNFALLLNPNGGNVGIGTSSPLGSTVERTLHLSDGGGGYATVYVTNSANSVRSIFGMQSSANLGIVGTQTNTPFAIFTNDTERMRITSGGVTLFGGTTFTTITSAVLGATNPAFTGRNWSFGPNSSGDYVVYHNQGGNTGVYLSYGGSSWTSNSDENIKDIIEVIPNALESIKDFRAVKFYWKGDESKKENIGLIAQDVQKSYPELIDKQIFDDKEILGVRYTELIPVLVKAIQEQQVQIEQLKALINK